MNEERDIVYILKNGAPTGELRYSLRSVAEFWPVRYVWFVGGCPDGFQLIHKIEHEQSGGTKWERAKSSLIKACKCPDVSEEFFLFNDDFFILQPPPADFINYTDGTIGHRVAQIMSRNANRGSSYTRGLEDLAYRLRRKGKDTISFAVHMPLLVNKYKMLDVLQSRDTHFSFRSLYGNLCEIPYTYHKDVKIYDMQSEPDATWDYLSTTEQSFEFGKVGVWIRERFPNPCKYEETEV